jgi:hypothetical protein
MSFSQQAPSLRMPGRALDVLHAPFGRTARDPSGTPGRALGADVSHPARCLRPVFLFFRDARVVDVRPHAYVHPLQSTIELRKATHASRNQ